MPSNHVTLTGRLTDDPKLNFLPSGEAVAEFTVACNERRLDRATNTWVDDDNPLYLSVTAWRRLGEGAAESLRKGSLVTVHGRLKADSWEQDGQKRTKVKVVADEIGSSVRFATTAAAPALQETAPF